MSAALKPLTLDEFLAWEPEVVTGLAAMLELPEISISIPLNAIYAT